MSLYIEWREWSPLAFTQAADERKPLLLSIVTAWSDECAAMDRTTYSDPAVVSLVLDRFVAVRVDADRRPDLNDRYNLGGWPTTVFLTSAGDVLSGGTYFDAVTLAATLRQVADAYRDRAGELAARAVTLRRDPAAPREPAVGRVRLPSSHEATLDRDSLTHFRTLLTARFDRAHGGFGSNVKLPHPHALLYALSQAADGDAELKTIVEVTLDRMRGLWDSSSGGFSRYADGADWSRPGTEKTLEDNAALLHVYVEAALRLRDARYRQQAEAIVRWVRTVMTDQEHGGFFNATSRRATDRSLYVDKNAMMAGALLRAAALFDDVWLRDAALDALEAVVVPAYVPGDGVGHVFPGGAEPVRGLLTDQIHVGSALIWAHAATGQLPYSMLAAEVLQFAARTMWDEASGRFRDRRDAHDPVLPFDLNCDAACAFDRLAVLTGDRAHQDRAHTILRSLADELPDRDLFGAPYALAVREVLDRRPPAGLELTEVDWKLT
jgi:uncharacterized protein YyaL (SSP411 family)